MKYGGNIKVLEKDIIEKVKLHVRDGIKKTSSIPKFPDSLKDISSQKNQMLMILSNILI